MLSNKQLLSLCLLIASAVASCYCLNATELPIKVCLASGNEDEAWCTLPDTDLLKQSYTFSPTINTDVLVRQFSFNNDAETTTAQVNNRIKFDCQNSDNNPITEVLDAVIPQLSNTVKFVNKFSSSCLEVYTKNSSAESGYYKLLLANGSIAEVYCDMVGTDCEDLGGWTRIGYFNMAKPESANCPSPLVSRKYTELSYELCQRQSFYSGCDSFFYDNLGIEYQSVCGRALGFQFGSPDAVQWSWYNIDSNYVDGMSITYETPRKHIWTYVAGVYEDGTGYDSCPCNHNSYVYPPSFLQGNYYCESGNDPGQGWSAKLYTDKLWDGKECDDNESNCCKSGNTLPWFSRLLSGSTTSNVELRLCDDENEDNERVPMEMVEIFIR